MSLTPGSRPRTPLCPSCNTPKYASTIELLEWAKRAGAMEMRRAILGAIADCGASAETMKRIRQAAEGAMR